MNNQPKNSKEIPKEEKIAFEVANNFFSLNPKYRTKGKLMSLIADEVFKNK